MEVGQIVTVKREMSAFTKDKEYKIEMILEDGRVVVLDDENCLIATHPKDFVEKK